MTQHGHASPPLSSAPAVQSGPARVDSARRPCGPIGTFSLRVRRSTWLLAWLCVALLVGEAPLLLSACCAPTGATGLGTVWFINDFAQYESAMRQGASQPGWLIQDVFTTEPHSPAFMFPLYVGLGKLSALLGSPPAILERLLEPLARGVFLLSLWRFCRAFAFGRSAARVAFLLAVFGSGFEVFFAAAGIALGRDGVGSSLSWSYETHTFGLLLAAAHVPLAMAGSLELARLGLRPRRDLLPIHLLLAAVLAAGTTLLHPFHVPVLLAALLAAGVVFAVTRRGLANVGISVAACLGALPVLWSAATTFNFDPFWSATYATQNVLPSPMPHELLVELGVTAVLAVLGVAFVVLTGRGRLAPFGLLLWLLLALVAMYLPVPYQRRLGFGLHPALAVVAGNVLVLLVRRWTPARARLARLAVTFLGAAGTVLVLVSVGLSGLRNEPLPVYRSTVDLDAAADWLASNAASTDVIMSDWSTANYLAPRTPARVFGGHPVATLRATEKQFVIATVFAHTSTLLAARQFGADWLVYGPPESGLSAPPDPDFTSGAVRVYRLTPR